MLAVQVEKPGPMDELAIVELPDPSPVAGEILVEVKSAVINFPDLLVITGRYQSTPPLPFVPGKEASGVVISVGDGVTRFRVGDHVLLHVEHGAYATRAVAKEKDCFPLPKEMPFADASVLGLAAQTAWFALHERGGFQAGHTVLVTGASGAVGQAAVQLVEALGGRAIAGASNIGKARAALSRSTCDFVDLSATDLRNSLREQVYERTDGVGVDIVIDTLGGDAFDAGLRSLAWCGRMVVVGFAAGRIPEIKANYLLVKNIAVSGLQWSDYRDRKPAAVASAHAGLVHLWKQGALKPVVARTIPFSDFKGGLEAMEARAASGRLVLTMD